MNNTELDLNHQKKKKKKQNSLETEFRLSKLKEKIEELEGKEDSIQNGFFWSIFGILLFGAASSYFFIKKPEHYFYPGLIFAGLAGLMVLLLIFSFYRYSNWKKKEKRELKELEKQEKELKDSV